MRKKAHGQIRRGQVITTFGPRSMLDLPRYSVLVGGLDEWSLEGREPLVPIRIGTWYDDRVIRAGQSVTVMARRPSSGAASAAGAPSHS